MDRDVDRRNSVSVSDGLFNVMLGSINTGLAAAIEGHDELYLGITVGTDTEMVPRVQLGSVPFSMQAMTVPDGSISTIKIADGAVMNSKLGFASQFAVVFFGCEPREEKFAMADRALRLLVALSW